MAVFQKIFGRSVANHDADQAGLKPDLGAFSTILERYLDEALTTERAKLEASLRGELAQEYGEHLDSAVASIRTDLARDARQHEIALDSELDDRLDAKLASERQELREDIAHELTDAQRRADAAERQAQDAGEAVLGLLAGILPIDGRTVNLRRRLPNLTHLDLGLLRKLSADLGWQLIARRAPEGRPGITCRVNGMDSLRDRFGMKPTHAGYVEVDPTVEDSSADMGEAADTDEAQAPVGQALAGFMADEMARHLLMHTPA
ncbi:MAG: hypothetical protein ACRERE_19940 [Candidatus Entotheonellia bacterium]